MIAAMIQEKLPFHKFNINDLLKIDHPDGSHLFTVYVSCGYIISMCERRILQSYSNFSWTSAFLVQHCVVDMADPDALQILLENIMALDKAKYSQEWRNAAKNAKCYE